MFRFAIQKLKFFFIIPVRDVFQVVLKSPVLHWLILFLAINTFFRVGNFVNPIARFITMAAIVEDGSFQVDKYHGWTVDWAHAPNGHYYSNKAPGPTFLAVPLYWFMDKIFVSSKATREDRDNRRHNLSDYFLHWLSLLLQVLPYALIVAFAMNWLKAIGTDPAGVEIAAILMLFGNSAALFMNTYFGHGMTCIFVLMLWFSIIKCNMFWWSFCLGWIVLSDYSASLLMLPAILALSIRKSWRFSRHDFFKIFLGALLPAGLWIWYHTVSFGNPFHVAMQFQNPDLVDTPVGSGDAVGFVSPLPRLSIFGELLFGPSRGILWTQYWVLIVLLFSPLHLMRLKRGNHPQRSLIILMALFFITGFALLLYMNSTLSYWYAGLSPGPRYLATVLPGLALLVGACYHLFPGWIKPFLWGSAIVSLFFYAMVMNHNHLAPKPPTALWSFYWEETSYKPKLWVLISLFLLGFGCSLILWYRRRSGQPGHICANTP